MLAKVRRNDVVQVIRGDDRGKQGRVLAMHAEEGRAVVEGINFVWKHVRRSQKQPKGARIKKESPISLSNLRVVCASCSKPTRVRTKAAEDGRRIRICGKCKQGVSAEG